MTLVRLFLCAAFATACAPEDPSVALRAELDALRAEITELRVEVEALRGDLRSLPRLDQTGNLPTVAGSIPSPPPGVEPMSVTVPMEVAVALRDAPVSELERLARAIQHTNADGEVDGYRLSGIRAAGPLHALGLRSGDIIHEVDGRRIRVPADVDGLNERLASAKIMRILLTRRGEPMRLVIEVR